MYSFSLEHLSLEGRLYYIPDQMPQNDLQLEMSSPQSSKLTRPTWPVALYFWPGIPSDFPRCHHTASSATCSVH